MIGSKKYYTNKLDKLISLKVRSKGKCERCGRKDTLQPAHIISRNNRTLRWDIQNILCLCAGCHFWAHQDPLGFTDFVKTASPDRYKYLMEMKDVITKRSKKDLKEMLISLGQ
jgi:hypothetical protein